ncbi:hypothetical protein G9A89_009519 [Geosiphon pyriformis]|nr:hypothetical protein G9A89_009519 [Geosiphon pyriformis]
MTSNVVVLLNSGKRQIVKTTPMMPLKQIVKTVCEKQGYPDEEKYGLKLNKATLDLALSVRFANLAPGAKLELIRVTAPKAQSEVTIALQVEDGARLIEKFPVTKTLWEILLYFEEIQNGSLNLTKRGAPAPIKKKGIMKKIGKKDNRLYYQQPVCLLVNQEYATTEILKSTTLQAAGITSGNAVLRVLFRHTEFILDEALARNVNTLEQTEAIADLLNPIDPERKEIIGPTTLPSANLTATSISGNLSHVTPEIKEVDTAGGKNMEDQDESSQTTGVPISEISSIEPQHGEESMELDYIKDDVIREETEESMEVDRSSLAAPLQLDSSDIVINQKSELELLDPESSSPLSRVEESSLHVENEPISSPHVENEPTSFENEPISFNRDAKVFKSQSNDNSTLTSIDLPDSFYELTANELRHLLAMQKAKEVRRENATLKTSAMRAQEEKEKEKKYPKTLIRIKFPDRYQLQGTFLSKEQVSELYRFVQGSLKTPDRPFHLYTTPPKKILADHSISLYQAKLAPASLVYFNWDQTSDILDYSYLSEELSAIAEDITSPPNPATSLIDFPSTDTNLIGEHLLSEPSQLQNPETLTDKKSDHSQSESTSNSVASLSSSRKLPKWLNKLGSK